MKKVGVFVVLIALMTSSISAQTEVHTGKAFREGNETHFCYDINKITTVLSGRYNTLLSIRTYYPNSQYLEHGMFAHLEWGQHMQLMAAYAEDAPKQTITAKFSGQMHEEQYDVPGYFCVTSIYFLPDDWHYNTIVLWDESGKLVYSGPVNR